MALLIISLIAGLAGLAVHQSQLQYRERATIATQNLSRVLEQYISAIIEKTDVSLQMISRDTEHRAVGRKIDETAINRLLAEQLSLLPELENLRATDAQGTIRFGPGVPASNRINLADRDFYTRLRDDANANLVISGPVFARISQKWVMVLARRLNHGDGSFAGVVYANIATDYFDRVFSEMSLGSRGAISLRTDELKLVARHPEPPGNAIGTNKVSQQLRDVVQADPVAGVYVAATALDKIERANAYRKVGKYPFYVIVGLATEDYLVEWHNEARRFWGLAILAACIVLLASWIIYRSWRRQAITMDALARQSERNQLLLRTASDGIHILDGDGNLLEVSDAFCALLGYGRDEILQMNVAQWDAHWSDAELQDKFAEQIVSRGTAVFETQHRRRDGSIIDIEISATSVELDGKRAIFASGRDITARKRTESALNELNRDFVSFLENTTDFIYFKDADSRFRFCSQTLADITGHASWRDMIGKHDREVFPEATARIYSEEEVPVFRDGVPLLGRIDPYFDAAGNPGWVSTNKWPILGEDRKVIGIFGISHDVTAATKAEAELEQYRYRLEELVQQRTAALMATEARASHLLAASADGLYGVDCAGMISFINPAACQLLGYRPEDVIGRAAHALFHHSRPDGSPFPIDECRGHDAVLRGHEMRVDNEVYWHADGHAVPVMYAVHPIVQDGVNSGAVISFVDMSEQRAAAQARERALLAAENLARVRSEFLANMSHEIRTPLNGVLGFAVIGHRNAHDSAKARNAFEKILRSGNLLLSVINEILDFSKIEAGKIHIEPTAVRLAEVIQQSTELIQERTRGKGLKLQVELAADLPEACLTDPFRLSQVLLNLLSNAVKFTERGGVTLAVSLQENDLVFRVSDTGIGMSADQLGLLFNPFQQADGSTTRRFGGTGLGLAISKRIIELLGGSIRVESTPGVGSTFEVHLPFLAALAAPNPPASYPGNKPVTSDKPLSGLSILVVEDDVINQLVIEDNLIEDGAAVVMVSNGREAMERVLVDGSQAYDVVLMDIQMPVMDGYEATQNILAVAPALPIIGQTAHASSEEREKCFAAGMVGHIAKPIDPQALVQTILKHVRQR